MWLANNRKLGYRVCIVSGFWTIQIDEIRAYLKPLQCGNPEIAVRYIFRFPGTVWLSKPHKKNYLKELKKVLEKINFRLPSRYPGEFISFNKLWQTIFTSAKSNYVFFFKKNKRFSFPTIEMYYVIGEREIAENLQKTLYRRITKGVASVSCSQIKT